MVSKIPSLSLSTVEKFNSSNEEGDGLIYVIRHAESEVNAGSTTTGTPIISGKNLEIPLSKTGKEQALALAEQLVKKISHNSQVVICSSTAIRAQKTAKPLFKKLQAAGFSCSLENDYEGLCERSQGDWEGKVRDANYMGQLNKWKALPLGEQFTTPQVEGIESFKEVKTRALQDLGTIFKKHRGNKIIFIVSHGNTINMIAGHTLGALPLLNNAEILVMKVPKNHSIEQIQPVQIVSG